MSSFQIHKAGLIPNPPQKVSNGLLDKIIQVPRDFSTIQKAISDCKLIDGGNYIIQISPGIYKEDICIVSDANITLQGSGRLNSQTVIHGSISLSKADYTCIANLTIISEQIAICITGDDQKNTVFIKDSVISSSTGACVMSEKSNVILNLCDLQSEKCDSVILSDGNMTIYASSINGPSALSLNKSSTSIENSNITGQIKLLNDALLEIKFSQINCIGNDNIVSNHDQNMVQLFFVIVMGDKYLKNGLGMSTRSGIISIGSATECIGGQDLIIPIM